MNFFSKIFSTTNVMDLQKEVSLKTGDLLKTWDEVKNEATAKLQKSPYFGGQKKVRVAINGFGRIGRAFVRQAMERDDIEIVVINDLGSIDNLAYLLKYDTVYREAKFEIEILENGVQADPKKPEIKPVPGKLKLSNNKNVNDVVFLSERMPENLPWESLNVDVVVECTGLFTSFTAAKVHIDKAGAKKVVISAPAKDDPKDNTEGTVLMGVNEEKLETCIVSSNASCTTNASSPIIAILDEALGIEKALLSTTHGYTASQSLVDAPNKKDFREGRAAAQNIVPSSTGAAIAVTKAFPKLLNLFDGISLRVPVPAGSIVDVTFISKKNTTAEEVNEILKKASKDKKWANIFSVTEEDLVSSDIQGAPFASIADLQFTRVVGGNLVKVLAWYDNESGYTRTLVDHVVKIGNIK
jgi:glyceraldehyde 3-phosphate dehydrogenase